VKTLCSSADEPPSVAVSTVGERISSRTVAPRKVAVRDEALLDPLRADLVGRLAEASASVCARTFAISKVVVVA